MDRSQPAKANKYKLHKALSAKRNLSAVCIVPSPLLSQRVSTLMSEATLERNHIVVSSVLKVSLAQIPYESIEELTSEKNLIVVLIVKGYSLEQTT